MMRNKKQVRIVRLALAAALSFMLLLPGAIHAKERDVMKNVGSYLQWNGPVTIVVDGNELPVQGVMENTHLLVPVRTVFEAMGAKVTWIGQSGKVHAQKQRERIELALGKSEAVVDGSTVQLDHSTILSGGHVMASLRIVPAAMKADFTWDLSTRTLSFTTVSDPLATLHLTSTAYGAEGNVPSKYAHQSNEAVTDTSIPISWENAPKETQSFAVVMYDLHPIADNWIHWSVIDLPPSTRELKEGAAELLLDAQQPNPYFGMGPPPFSGDHPYRIVVYALDVEKLALPQEHVFFEDLKPILAQHTLAYGVLNGYFAP